MPNQASLLDRRDEAFNRIEQVIGRVATPHSVKVGALTNVRHDNPEVAAVMRVETLAKILSEVADAQDKAAADARTAASQPIPVAAPTEMIAESPAKTKS